MDEFLRELTALCNKHNIFLDSSEREDCELMDAVDSSLNYIRDKESYPIQIRLVKKDSKLEYVAITE